MILAANRCRDRSPDIYVADGISEISGILNPKVGDVAMLVIYGEFLIWRLRDSNDEPDGFYIIESNSCGYVWVLSGSSAGSTAVLYGTGSPEGSLARGVGSIYTDITDPDHPVVWVKTSGGFTSSGWVQLISI